MSATTVRKLGERTLWDYNAFLGAGHMLLTPGEIDESAIKVFTRGHCHSLALAIHKLTGLEMVGTQEPDFGGDIAHVAIKVDDDLYLDILGLQDTDTFIDDGDFPYGTDIVPVDEWMIRSWVKCGEFDEPRVEDATPFAKALLDREGIPYTEELALAA